MSNEIVIPIIVGLVLAFPSFSLGVYGYRRAQRQDRNQTNSQAVAQIITGLEILVDSLQGEKSELRTRVYALEAKLESALETKVENLQLKAQIVRLEAQLDAANVALTALRSV